MHHGAYDAIYYAHRDRLKYCGAQVDHLEVWITDAWNLEGIFESAMAHMLYSKNPAAMWTLVE
eukprot:5296755-Lingulodinium_polyedra.AAC.1